MLSQKRADTFPDFGMMPEQEMAAAVDRYKGGARNTLGEMRTDRKRINAVVATNRIIQTMVRPRNIGHK